MRNLILFLAAVSLVLFAEKALCYETTFSIGPESFNSFRYQEMRAEEAAPLSIRTGRFLSVDPVLDVKKALQEPQRWNRYVYVLNTPLNATDPTGMIAAMVYGHQMDVEPGDVVVLYNEQGHAVHTSVVGGFVDVEGQKHPNAQVWEAAPGPDAIDTGAGLVDTKKHQATLVDLNDPAAGAGRWNAQNTTPLVLQNRAFLEGTLTYRPFSTTEVFRAIDSVGPFRYVTGMIAPRPEYTERFGPTCDCAYFADEVTRRLGGTLNSIGYDGVPYTITDWGLRARRGFTF